MMHLLRSLASRLILVLALPCGAFASNTVVNLSHYDAMRPDFETMRAEGIVGVIHAATYPRFVWDAKCAARQEGAARAGVLWGADHLADNTDPIRQAGHLLATV